MMGTMGASAGSMMVQHWIDGGPAPRIGRRQRRRLEAYRRLLPALNRLDGWLQREPHTHAPLEAAYRAARRRRRWSAQVMAGWEAYLDDLLLIDHLRGSDRDASAALVGRCRRALQRSQALREQLVAEGCGR